MPDYKVHTRDFIDKWNERYTEVVFNYTDCDYFSLVPPEDVSEYNTASINYHRDGRTEPLEIRTVDGLYRGKRYYFTLVRFYGNWYSGNASYGRQIANNLAELFGETFYRIKQLRTIDRDANVIEIENPDLWKYRFSNYNVDNLYAVCFKPTYGYEGYCYKAFDGNYSGVRMYEPCPYGMCEDRCREKPVITGTTECDCCPFCDFEKSILHKLDNKIIICRMSPAKQKKKNNAI